MTFTVSLSAPAPVVESHSTLPLRDNAATTADSDYVAHFPHWTDHYRREQHIPI